MKPVSLAQALRASATPPEGQDSQAWSTARAVLHQEAAPELAEALPQALLLALLDALVEERRAGPVDALAVSAAKPVAKAARRAQYRLRSAGVATRSPVSRAPAAAPAEEATPQLPSLVSPPDGSGEMLLLVAQSIKGGLSLYEVVLSDEVGLLAYRELEASRSAWRRTLREATGQPLREISLEEARRLLSEALRCNLATHSPMPKGADGMLRRLQVVPATTPLPPLPSVEPGDATLALEGARLHEEPELRGWLPPEGELKLLAARVQEVQSSPLALSEAQRTVQLDERVRAMAEAFFTPERSQLYARRLWLLADVFERTGRRHPAEVARAEARRLFHHGSGLFSRFAESLYAKLLPPAGEGTGTAATPATPGPKERRTKGGLILP